MALKNMNKENHPIHLIQCSDCGLDFDPSDLANVFAHEHSNQTMLPSGKYLGEQIGTNDGGLE